MYKGCWLLGANGEGERVPQPARSSGNIRRMVGSIARGEYESTPRTDEPKGWLVVQSRIQPEVREAVPLICGNTWSSCRLLWSSDSKRILICEQAGNADGALNPCRVYDLPTDSPTKFRLPGESSPTDWSSDGKRLLTTLRTEGEHRRRVRPDRRHRKAPNF